MASTAGAVSAVRATGHQLRLQHDFDADWSLLVGASVRDTLLTGLSSDAELVASRQRRSSVYDSRQWVIRAELSGAFQTGALTHRILIGADHDQFDNDQQFGRFRPPLLSGNPSDQAGYVIEILNPVYGRFPLPMPGPQNDRLDVQRSTGVFIQDQIVLTDRLQIRIGDPLINIPDHAFNAQASKRFDVGGRMASFGAGVQYVGGRSGETGTAFTLPAHTLVRLFGEVEIIDGMTLFGAVQNLFDARWHANGYAPLWAQPGAPRTASLGLRGAF